MKRVMKRLFLVAVFVMLFGLMGCGTTLTTNMSVSDNFAGSRTMDVSIDKTTFDENAPEDGFKQLAAETAENTAHSPPLLSQVQSSLDGSHKQQAVQK